MPVLISMTYVLVEIVSSIRKIKDLLVGDVVQGLYGFNEVECITCDPHTQRDLVLVGNTVLTSEHPIMVDGTWIYPKDISSTVPNEHHVVYNFVMKGTDHTILVDGIICATLGCGPENLKLRDTHADEVYGSGFWKTYNENKSSCDKKNTEN